MVGGLVEEQHVGLLNEQTAQGDAATFTAGKELTGLICGRAMESCHGAVETAVEIPGIGGVDDVLQFTLAGEKLVHLVGIFVVFGKGELLIDLFVLGQGFYDMLHAFLYDFAHGLCWIELWFLGKIAHRIARREDHFALIVVVETGNDLEEGRFTGTVETDDTDFCSVEEAEINVLENGLVGLANGFCQTDHGENNFFIVYCCHR